jgi:hypothetical protein
VVVFSHIDINIPPQLVTPDMMEAPGSLLAEISRVLGRTASRMVHSSRTAVHISFSNEKTKFYLMISQLDQQYAADI